VTSTHGPLNVIQVCFSKSWGGLEMSALSTTAHFFDRGHRSICLCLKDSELHKNLHERRLPHRSIGITSHYWVGSILKVRETLSRHRAHVVHCHFLHDLWLVAPALWNLPQVKLLATCHMLFSRTKKKDWAHRLIYRRLDKLIVLTNIAKSIHLRALPVSAEDMVVIPNGVDLSEFSPASYSRDEVRQEFSVGPEQPLVGCIGRLDPGKGQQELIRSAKEVIAEFPDCKFLIVGEATKGQGQSFPDKLRGLIRESDLEDRVILAGFRADAARVLRALDIFAFPSYKETFGMSLLEAMAMSVPIVATDSGAVPEILDYGKCGLLVPPRQSHPLAEAVKRYLREPGLAGSMAHQARKRVEQEYDLRLVLSRIENLYFGSPRREPD
jgi:D-inositol-3-phosphate glycosyltransferase